MSESHEEIRALRVMVEELKAEPPPELPWDAIEQRLLARVAARDAEGVRTRASWLRPGPALLRSIGICAAAAAIALGVSYAGDGQSAATAQRPAPAPATMGADAPKPPVAEPRRVDATAVAPAPGQAGAQGARDLRALDAGDVIETGEAPVTFARAGLVAWTLAPHSAVRVRTMGDAESGVGHTVALERGSIRAEVTPRDASEGLVEAFAVEASRTRVAVHGTAFSVTLIDGRAVVDVEHGAVAIGPIGHVGATTGHLLIGPQRGSFSLDGGRSARLLPRDPTPEPVAAVAPAPVEEPPAAPGLGSPAPAAPAPVAAVEPAPVAGHVAPAPQPVAVGRVAEAPKAAPPPEPEPPKVAPAPPLLTVAAVRARLDHCFRTTYDTGAASSGLSVSSTLRVALNPDGSVRSARFDPPLKPEMVGCAGSIMGGRFAEGTGNVDIPVSFRP